MTWVHIVRVDDKHIVPRMSDWLAEINGWTISSGPEPGADVYYYAPYLSARGKFPERGLLTGWFTHYETANRAKREQWALCAERFDQRLITAPVYMDGLLEYGPTVQVLPGADERHFRFRSRQKRGQNIGCAYVRSVRKGVHLVDAIARAYPDKLRRLDGRRGQWLPYEQMPNFYNDLAVYVCTSTEEGIPAPLIEAMLCGVKVVAPLDVGAEPVLRTLPGVYSYAAGDEEAMFLSIEQALSERWSRERIREAALAFTRETWAITNKQAVDRLVEEKHGGLQQSS